MEPGRFLGVVETPGAEGGRGWLGELEGLAGWYGLLRWAGPAADVVGWGWDVVGCRGMNQLASRRPSLP